MLVFCSLLSIIREYIRKRRLFGGFWRFFFGSMIYYIIATKKMRSKWLFQSASRQHYFYKPLRTWFVLMLYDSFVFYYCIPYLCVFAFYFFSLFRLTPSFGILFFSSFCLCLCLFNAFFSFLLTYLLSFSLLSIYNNIIIYNTLISFVCVRICAHTCTRTRQTRHKKKACFWHSLLLA